MKVYLLTVYDWLTGETIEKTNYKSEADCVLAFLDLEKCYKKDLDYYIKEVDLDETYNVCN